MCASLKKNFGVSIQFTAYTTACHMQVVFWRPKKYAEWDIAMSPPTCRGTFTPPPQGHALPAVFGWCLCRKLWYDPNTKWQNMHYTKLKQNTTLCYTTLVSVPYKNSVKWWVNAVFPTHITAQGCTVATLLTTPTNGTANWPRCTRVSRCPTVENEVRKNFNSGKLNICRSKMKPCWRWEMHNVAEDNCRCRNW